MKGTNREYIAVGFDRNTEKIIPIMRLNSGGGRKTIHGVGGIGSIELYHIAFSEQKVRRLGMVQWPDVSLVSNVILDYSPEEGRGTACIQETGVVWMFSLRETAGTDSAPARAENEEDRPQETAVLDGDGIAIVDKEKVRRLEEEKDARILWPDELAGELQKEIFGQDEAIKKISELISANLRRSTSEVEVIVLFGPTGVGKTEVGKAIPKALEKLTGQKYGLQQIALNEFIGEHSLNRFFGSPPSYVGYRDPTVFEPCRTNPYQVFLLDEIEKSTDRIWTGLMECFSSGVVKLADNTPEIDLSHCIFIITSNIPIDMAAYESASTFGRKELCRDALTRACGHPEIAGKITNCLAFRALPSDALTDIVSKFVVQELQNYGMELQHMDERLMVQLKEQHSNYGARGVRDAVREALMNTTVYDRNISRYRGKRVRLAGDMENISIEIVV